LKAAVVTAPETIEVVDWSEPEVGDGEVLVKMEAVGICGSDLAAYTARDTATASSPRILGHEGVGRVVSVPDGAALKVGQRVVIEPNYCCGTCVTCRRGLTSGCERKVIVGASRPGLLAEYASVPSAFAWPMPERVPLLDAACTEPLAVVVAALRRVGVSGGQEWLVIGAGSLGLLTCLALRHVGASAAVVDTNPLRVQRAGALGAGQPESESFEYAMDTTGVASALAAHGELLATGARVALLGISEEKLSITYRTAVRRQLSLLGSLIYDHPHDFRKARDLVASGELSPSAVVDATYPIEDAPLAFADARSRGGKSVICF